MIIETKIDFAQSQMGLLSLTTIADGMLLLCLLDGSIQCILYAQRLENPCDRIQQSRLYSGLVVPLRTMTSRTNATSRLDTTTTALRKMALEAGNGVLLGGEDALAAKCGTSRATLRQAARLLEREGLLKVRRGIKGGYFAARPTFNAIEYAFVTHHEILDPSEEDLTEIPSLLWVEAVRRATRIKTEESGRLVKHFLGKIRALCPDASWGDVFELERECRSAIFELLKCRYIEFLFNTSVAFAYKKGFPNPSDRDDTGAHSEFVDAWRKAKIIELEMIAAGDEELAMIVARRMRGLWHRRVWGHDYR